MSLATNIQNLATRIATETKSLRTLLNGNAADLSALTTTNKTNLVAALNEVKGLIGQAGPQIDDLAASTSTVYSSSKTVAAIDAAVDALVGAAPGVLDTLEELAAALGNDADAITSINAALANRVRTDAAQGLEAEAQYIARTNIAAASATELATLTTNVGDTTTNFVTTFEAGLA